MNYDRRSMLVAMGGAATAGHASAVGLACAGQAASQPGAGGHTHAHVDRQDGLRETVGRCIVAGDACLAHCLEALGAGDTSLADCSKAVHDMLATCRGVGPLAATNSPLFSAVAKLCVAACERCRDACEPHIDMHPECRNCHDRCVETIDVVGAALT